MGYLGKFKSINMNNKPTAGETFNEIKLMFYNLGFFNILNILKQQQWPDTKFKVHLKN